jgi:hypothetical protein
MIWVIFGIGLFIVAGLILFVATLPNPDGQAAAVKCVRSQIVRFIERRHRPPKSWAELSSVYERGDGFLVPGTENALLEYLDVDFALSLERIALSDSQKFEYVKLKDHAFYNYSGIFGDIIRAAKREISPTDTSE